MSTAFPFTRRQAVAGAVALLVVLAVGGRLVSSSGREGGAFPSAAVPISEAPTARVAEPQVVVHVAGAVRRPGLYRLEDGSRVADALALAGGPTRRADVAAVNLAAPLVDGTQVLVPKVGQAAQPTRPGSAGAGGAPPVRLSTATLEELETIPGVGPVTAQRIIEFREQNGPFRSVDELDAVPGIGPKRLEQLRELVTP